jgi:glycosyltransferase involved in cell wall biosynthesis
MPQVSVVVPLYNKGPWIERAMQSIASQTFSDFEAIVVDDGSTDDGPRIAAQFHDQRFRLVRQENAGPGAARNRGLAQASASLVAFLDADDEWLPDYLERAVAAIQRSGAASVSFGYMECPGDRSTLELWRKRGLNDGLVPVTPAMDPAQLVAALAFMMPCNTVAFTETIRKWGGFYSANRCRYAEDAFLWLKVLLNEKVWFDFRPGVRIHFETSALSKNLVHARPLEPFLEYPALIRAECPPELLPLLDHFLAARAFKTACVWSYWGKWREARRLRQRFRTAGDQNLPLFWASALCATPLGAAAGAMARTLRLK